MEKVENGKLLRIKTEFDDKINKVEITGDFFAHPEICINKIEEFLSKLPINFDDNELTENLSNFIKDNNFELIGINAEAIVRVLKNSLGN